MYRLYLDTSVLIALANNNDEFHRPSAKFVEESFKTDIEPVVGPPILIEIGKAVRLRGIDSSQEILQALARVTMLNN